MAKNEKKSTETTTETEAETIKISFDTEVDELSAALKSAEEFKDLAQRVQAEFDNFRRRNAESVRIARKEGIDDVVTALLLVLDNFERGLSALKGAEKSGMELIYKQMISILEKYDVSEIDALGQPFDPKYHHAIAQCEEEGKENLIVEVFQKGYIRKDKVLRPAMVKVAQ